jgi:hypothetical protein
LLTQIPYGEIRHEAVVLPQRIHDPSYHRDRISPEMYVPAIFCTGRTRIRKSPV